MYTRHICVSAHEKIADISRENSGITAMLSELAAECAADGRKVVAVAEKDGRRYFTAGSYCGFACLADGTLIEILPPVGSSAAYARNVLCAEFCRRCGHKFSPADMRPDSNFLEYVISVFAGETMKIIKSGVLSNYTSCEENLTSVQGTILFAENIRRNLVHRERIYVRHDIFTPDRAENRIIKAAASMFMKLTADSRSSHLLKEALSFLDDVKLPFDPAAEFSKCINTRNTKKYSTILSICRMLFDRNEGTALSGKYISCAQFYKMTIKKPRK